MVRNVVGFDWDKSEANCDLLAEIGAIGNEIVQVAERVHDWGWNSRCALPSSQVIVSFIRSS